MPEIIDSVASLIAVRDKDDLEITLADVMFELVKVSTLTIWRVSERGGDVRLSQRVRLDSSNSTAAAPRAMAASEEASLREARAELRAAYDTKLHFRGLLQADGSSCNVFPVVDGVDVICLIELECPTVLREAQEQLIFGFLRIYRSHLGLLDYSDTDELTGLSNRRPFDETFRRIVSSEALDLMANKDGAPDCGDPAEMGCQAHIAVADIDFFKRINDQFGHPYGDEVLVILAGIMRDCFRDDDRLFRFGGEEFVVILSGISADQAELALQKFRRAVEHYRFPQVGHVTISIGMTTIRPGDTGADAFGRADEALYVVKHGGRNQVRRYEFLIAEGVLTARSVVAQDIEVF